MHYLRLFIHALLSATLLFVPSEPYSASPCRSRSRSTHIAMQPTKQDGQVLAASTAFPVIQAASNLYSLFYWFPRRNVLYDRPWVLFRNTTREWFAWHQVPHNLPPYRYIDSNHPPDFFCWGLPGNTLPLGDWDPWGLQQVSPEVVLKYRESELKHGRVAMLACVGMLVQEMYHPLYGGHIGGLAITHVQQFRDMHGSGVLHSLLQLVGSVLPVDATNSVQLLDASVSMDYWALLAGLAAAEAWALRTRWARWGRAEVSHQFDHHIGIGNIRQGDAEGRIFDPLQLMPENGADRKFMVEAELNHGRLAMLAAIGMLVQEYMTGLPLLHTFHG